MLFDTVKKATEQGIPNALNEAERLTDAGFARDENDRPVTLAGTTTRGEYRFAKESLGLDETQLRNLAANSWHAAFCSREIRERGLKAVSHLELRA